MSSSRGIGLGGPTYTASGGGKGGMTPIPVPGGAMPVAVNGGPQPVAVNGGPVPVAVNGAPAQGGGSFGAPSMAGLQSLAASFGAGAPSPGIAVSAQTNPALDALLARSTANLDRLTSGGGELMDTAAGRIRDIREGGRSALGQSEGMRGVSSSNRMGQYEADTSRGEMGAITDITNNRQQNLTSAIQGGLGVAGAGQEMALREKQFGLATQQAASQSANDNFAHFMALLQAQRSSPIYSGSGTGY